MMVGRRILSYWEGNFSGAMLNFGRVEAKACSQSPQGVADVFVLDLHSPKITTYLENK